MLFRGSLLVDHGTRSRFESRGRIYGDGLPFASRAMIRLFKGKILSLCVNRFQNITN